MPNASGRAGWTALLIVWVAAATLVLGRGSVTAQELDPQDEGPTRIHGRVIGADGHPLADTVVSAVPHAGTKPGGWGRVDSRTDEDGHFQMAVPARRFQVAVRPPSARYEPAQFRVYKDRIVGARGVTKWELIDGVLKPLVTLLRTYVLDFEIIDDLTGQAIEDAVVLCKLHEDDVFDDGGPAWALYHALENGEFTFRQRVDTTMNRARIYVAAPGYASYQMAMNEQLQRGQPVVKEIALQPRPNVELTMLTPEGLPADDAVLQVMPRKEVRRLLRQSKLESLLNDGTRSDAAGEMRLPYPAFAEWVSYRITHASGYAHLSLADLLDAPADEALVRTPVQLAPYGAIRGRFVPKPGDNEFLEIYQLKSDRKSVDGRAVLVELDQQGRFGLDGRLGGWHSFVHRVRYRNAERAGSIAVASYGPFALVPGETLQLTLGNEGQPVVGRVVAPDDFDPSRSTITVSLTGGEWPGYPRPPAVMAQDPKVLKAWWDWYWESDTGKQLRAYYHLSGRAVAGPDGQFRFPMVRPGKYKLLVGSTPRDSRGRFRLRMELEVPPGSHPEPLDLGSLHVQGKGEISGQEAHPTDHDHRHRK